MTSFIDNNALARALVSDSGQSDPRSLIGETLLSQALDPGQIRHPLEGAASMLKAVVGARMLEKAKTDATAKRATTRQALANALQAGMATPQIGMQEALADELMGGGAGRELAPGGGFQDIGAEPGGIDAALQSLLTSESEDAQSFGAMLGLENLFGAPEGDAFTLGEGQTRFGPDGEVIARGAEKAADRFEDVFDGQGNLIGQRNTRTNRFRTVGKDRGPTPPQKANNAEIVAARDVIRRLEDQVPPGSSLRQEIATRMTPNDPVTNRVNRLYDPTLENTLKIALQHQVGEDPDFAVFNRLLNFEVAEPEPSAPAPAPTREKGSFLGRNFERLFGGSNAPAANPAATPSGPRGRRGGVQSSGTALIESMSLEDLDVLVAEQGESLTEPDRARIAARLQALTAAGGGRRPSPRRPGLQ